MKRLACLLVLAGCPARGPAPQAPAAAGVGCPAPTDVHVASYLTQEDASSGHTGWVLPLHDARVAKAPDQPEYAAIDAAAAAAAGVPAAPSQLWLMLPGQAPCKATIGAYYAAVVDSSVANITYGVELTGCAAPPKEQQQDAEAIALVSEQAPTECQVVPPQPVAARLGETDAQKQWQRPTKQTAMPPAFAAAVPARDCRAPGCETLWAVAQVSVGGQPVAWSGAVNWLTIPAGATPASQCTWKAETFAGFFVADPRGNAVKVTEGQTHPLLLSAVLADRSGPRAAITQGPGEYAVYELGHGGAKLARQLTWLALPDEAYALDERLGPVCEDGDAR